MKSKLKFLSLRGKKLELPAFFPDATYGHIIGVTSRDLIKNKVDGVVVNTYHLLRHKLIRKISKMGGIHRYMKFNKPIISDSGGFQVFSLIHQKQNKGKIGENDVTFYIDRRKIKLTPESCIKTQMKIGADIIMCLDDCTHADFDLKLQRKSVERTIRWARRCKDEFVRLTKNLNESKKPLLFAIVQGGKDKKLRKYCAEELVKIGFDGYAYGGWPVSDGKLLKDILKYVAELLPDDKPKYAMGVGKPGDIIECCKMGYNLFDCVIPTRDARHRRYYIYSYKNKINHKFFYLRGRHRDDENPISKLCDCCCCRKYSLADLHKFFKLKDERYIRFASIHNLRFYSQLMETLRR